MVKRNANVYDGKIELEEWIRNVEKIFTVVEGPADKKMNTVTFYLLGKANI